MFKFNRKLVVFLALAVAFVAFVAGGIAVASPNSLHVARNGSAQLAGGPQGIDHSVVGQQLAGGKQGIDPAFTGQQLAGGKQGIDPAFTGQQVASGMARPDPDVSGRQMATDPNDGEIRVGSS